MVLIATESAMMLNAKFMLVLEHIVGKEEKARLRTQFWKRRKC